MQDRVNNPARTRGRPFQPGNSGRPKGALNKRTLLAERIMGEDLEGITRAVVSAATGGDMTAARLIFERMIPVRRGRPVQFDMPDAADAAGIAEAFGSVLKAMAAGEITPEEAAAVASVLEARRKAIETAEIEARLKALEERASKTAGSR